MKTVDKRLPALIRFATAITVLNLVGHAYLGFEPSPAHVVVALATAYSLELLFEAVTARTEHRMPIFMKSGRDLFYFLLPSHISALACSMLLFTNTNMLPLIFATAVAILSKVIFKVPINGRMRHFLNPSNTGIAVCLLLFPAVSTTPPYQFSENVSGYGDWVLIGIFTMLGSFLNAKFTKKIPLIAAWLGGFFLQAVIRTNIFGTSTLAALAPMTGVAFLLFTFYMISDPSTTPMKTRNQIAFGFSVAALYGVLMSLHIVFGLFLALFTVCTARGLYFWILSLDFSRSIEPVSMEFDRKPALEESIPYRA
jgi:Na+-translocating ferredoxin:NAD+ oxidoreductase RnfD subunit